jgi:TRAP-type C4-dicarboxylate transport system permease small subunit
MVFSFLKNTWRWILRLTHLASQAVLAFMLFAICFDVAGRAFFNSPTDWSIEVTSFLVIFIGTIGAAEVLHHDSHIRMNFLEGLMPERMRGVVLRLWSALGVVLCANFVWFGGRAAWQAWEYGSRVSSAFGTPLFIPKALLPIVFGLLGIQFLIQIFVAPLKK